MAGARVGDGRRDLGYESSTWSDGSVDIEVDTHADGDYVAKKGEKDDDGSSDDGDFDMEVEASESKLRTAAVVVKKETKKRGPYKKNQNLTLDIRPEGKLANEILVDSTRRPAPEDAEARRVAFEKMAGAFRSALTGSARDKAKAAFVQAWCALVLSSFHFIADSLC